MIFAIFAIFFALIIVFMSRINFFSDDVTMLFLFKILKDDIQIKKLLFFILASLLWQQCHSDIVFNI